MFLKWAGGKRRLLEYILPFIPADVDTYYEPFLGGGAVFFALPQGTKAVLGDVNSELINCYNAARQEPEAVLKELRAMAVKQEKDKDYYYEIRNTDRDILSFRRKSPAFKAARFIIINRLGFNGLWRVNAKNQCNVPFGHRKFTFDEGAFRAAVERLATADVAQRDFTQTVKDAKEGDFVYFDPPYIETFTGYTKTQFPIDEQERLRRVGDELRRQRVKFVVSNSDTEETRRIWNGYEMQELSLFRAIGCKDREKGKELLIFPEYARPQTG